GAAGADAYDELAYGHAVGIVSFGTVEPYAEIPVVVEAWAKGEGDETFLFACVNRTPVAGAIEAARDKRDIDAFGCGLSHTLAQAPIEKHFCIVVNVTTPYMPITSDGKEPNLCPFVEVIQTAVQKAVRAAHRPTSAGKRASQKEIVLDNLDHAVAVVSGDGE